ncbi:MAG: sialate O-acetylesterase [Salinivenus sp.]
MAQETSSLLHPVFQDHVVLQRDTTLRVWGTAAPDDTVAVSVAGASGSTVVKEDGAWSVRLSPLPPGGPHRLIARSSSGAVQVVRDVLVGDVYLCAGQSNMELPVDRTLDAPNEIQRAGNEQIRMLDVPRTAEITPASRLPESVGWEVAGPETVADWSATCYYFARSLQPTVDVPIGLINSSWGGSKIQAWMSEESLDAVGGYDRMLSLLDRYERDRRGAQQAFGEDWEAWWEETTGTSDADAPWRPATGTDWTRAPEGLGNWLDWSGTAVEGFHGMVWFRSTVDLTAEQAEEGAVLSLGPIDEIDQTWINGHVVGNTFGWGTERMYAVPGEHLREGENVVVTNVLNTYGSGGLLETEGLRGLETGTGDRRPLRDWRFKKAAPDLSSPPRTPWHSVGGLTTLHNAMVAPLHGMSLKGAMWYQGESDTDRPETYQSKLEELMAQWRETFGENLPVFVVQLANYGEVPTEPTSSNWAELREAQRRAVKGDPNAALAVTIDIGTSYDIHPPNKQEVGRRLVRAARHVAYGEEGPPSGPVPVAATREAADDRITVTFEDAVGGLVARGDDNPIGFELCGGENDDCHYANAEIDGRDVHLRSDQSGSPTRVRYCWGDSPVCTLYDEDDMPAGPFEMEVTAE